MCGINGIVTSSKEPDLIQKLDKMNSKIIHRGPDDAGIFLQETNSARIAMAMRRLSIIDLSTGKQPLYSRDKKISIVYNGEIYNYLELKEELLEQGITFTTTSDTEVILKLYEKYGVASFSRLDGMFAFSIYDDTLKKLFIARDFFGEKPLYYTKEGSSFYWASELKSILEVCEKQKKISNRGLNLYFQLTYIPAPNTIFEDVYKLEANHYLTYDCQTHDIEIKTIEHNFSNPKFEGSFEDAKNQTHSLVQNSVRSRSVADVPLGTFLSGGVDSSIISLCLAQQSSRKIDTFSVGFEKKSFDESEKSRTVANLIDSHHHEFVLTQGDLKESLDQILLNFDEPFADSSSLATYLVANKTRQHVKVALTGDGGDEVFGGYNKYYMGRLNSKYTTWVPKPIHQPLEKISSGLMSTKDDNRGLRFKLKRLLKSINYEGDFYYNIISLGFQKVELMGLFEKEYYEENPLNYYKIRNGNRPNCLTDFRNIDRALSLEGDMLVKVDRTSMLTSLESRAPFLNKELWEFSSSLPESYLINGWNKKFILKESFQHYFPEGFLNKSKKGFGVPVGDWLRGHLKNELLSYIDEKFLKRQEIFNTERVRSLVNNHLEGREDNTFKVWTLYCFQKWYVHICSPH